MSDIIRPEDLTVGLRVLLIQKTASASRFEGKITRITGDRVFKTVWFRRNEDPEDSDGIGVQLRLSNPDWTFYRLPEAAGQGAPSGGRRRSRKQKRTRRVIRRLVRA